MSRGLADLHLHLYGAIRPADCLESLTGRPVDWPRYESAYLAAYGVPSPARTLVARHARGEDVRAAWEELFVFGPADAGNFARFQAKFDLLLAGSAFGEPDATDEALVGEMRFFVERILAEQVRQGTGYAEHRMLFPPTFTAERIVHLSEAILGSFAAEATTTTRLALSLPRADPWPAWEAAQHLALSPSGEAFTGIDFCFVEEGFPPKQKAELFAEVGAFNARHPERALAILYHVGESFTDKSLESAVRWVEQSASLGAHRLGHAIALGVDPAVYGEHEREESVAERRDQIDWELEHADGLVAAGVAVDRAALRAERAALETKRDDESLTHRYDTTRLEALRRRQDYAMDRVRESGAVIEVCPSSNLRIGGIDDPRHHPVHRFAERGVPFVVASDDPGIFGTTLRDELDWVERALGLDAAGARDLVARSWRCRSEVLVGREPA